MEDINILVPIGDRDVDELRLFLAIFGADTMTNDNQFITIHTTVNVACTSEAANLLTEQIIVDSSIQE